MAKTIKNKPVKNEITENDTPNNTIKDLNLKYEKEIEDKDGIIRQLKERINTLEIFTAKNNVKNHTS